MANAHRPGGFVRTLLEVVGLLVGALIVSILVGVVFVVPMLALGFDLETTPFVLGLTAVGQVAILVIGATFIQYRAIPVSITAPTRSDAVRIVIGVGAALLVAVVLSTILTVFDLLPTSVIDDYATSDPTFLLGLAVLSVILVAPAEETLFRGAIQGRLRQRVGPWPAIAVSSLLFGSLHLTNYGGEPAAILAGASLIAGVGAVLGVCYEYTDNLFVPIAVHGLYNVILVLLAFISL